MVDLPAPVSPTSATVSPGRACADRCRAAPRAAPRPASAEPSSRGVGRDRATLGRPVTRPAGRLAAGIGESHRARASSSPRSRPGSSGSCRLRGQRLQLHQLGDAADRDPGLLPGVEHLRQLLDRREEHVDVEDEGDQRAGRQMAGHDQSGARRRARSRRRTAGEELARTGSKWPPAAGPRPGTPGSRGPDRGSARWSRPRGRRPAPRALPTGSPGSRR